MQIEIYNHSQTHDEGVMIGIVKLERGKLAPMEIIPLAFKKLNDELSEDGEVEQIEPSSFVQVSNNVVKGFESTLLRAVPGLSIDFKGLKRSFHFNDPWWREIMLLVYDDHCRLSR